VALEVWPGRRQPPRFEVVVSFVEGGVCAGQVRVAPRRRRRRRRRGRGRGRARRWLSPGPRSSRGGHWFD